MDDKLKDLIKSLREEANLLHGISLMYKEKGREKEERYHYGKYVGLRDTANKIENNFLLVGFTSLVQGLPTVLYKIRCV